MKDPRFWVFGPTWFIPKLDPWIEEEVVVVVLYNPAINEVGIPYGGFSLRGLKFSKLGGLGVEHCA